MTYLEFLKTKIELATESGFEIDTDLINPTLKPHQQAAKKMDHDKEQIDIDKLKSRLMDLKGIGPVKAEQIVEVVKEVVE